MSIKKTKNVQTIVDEINILKPDFAIMVGDLIQGDTSDKGQLDAEWQEFWEHQSKLNIPFLPLL